MEENVKTRKSNVLMISVVSLGILFLIALAVMLLYVNKASKLSQDNGDLNTNILTLNGQIEQQIAQNQEHKDRIAFLNDSITTIKALNTEQLRVKDGQIYSLRKNTKKVTELEKEIAELRRIDVEHEKLQNRYDKLLAETLRKKENIKELSEQLLNLQDSVNKARFLHAYNINPLTKWNRWLCADRYNVSIARRVNETYITFEIAGTPFTKQGIRVVYMRMLDPSGNLINPIGEEFKYTGMQEINYTGDYVPVNFLVVYNEKLLPGSYTIQAFIDKEMVRETVVVLD